MLAETLSILDRVLSLGERVTHFDAATPLLGGVAEFDSMAVVAVITAIEEDFGVVVDDDEVSAETFETVGSLARFIESKVGTTGDE